MKPLPQTLRKNGFDYTQIIRGEKTCIYKQGLAENLNYFEVFLIRIKPERTFKGSIIESHEAFPHDEAFGNWAWSYRNYESAYHKFLELENKNGKKCSSPFAQTLTCPILSARLR